MAHSCPSLLQTGVFIPEKSNIWRDCVDGNYDWVREHLEEVSYTQLISTIYLMAAAGNVHQAGTHVRDQAKS